MLLKSQKQDGVELWSRELWNGAWKFMYFGLLDLSDQCCSQDFNLEGYLASAAARLRTSV